MSEPARVSRRRTGTAGTGLREVGTPVRRMTARRMTAPVRATETPGARAGTRDRGTVTAELALVLPVVVVVLLVALTVGAGALAQVRCADAARAGARASALGEPHEVVVATAERLAGADAEVSVSADAGWVEVTVTRPVPGLLGWVGALEASATASAVPEPGG